MTFKRPMINKIAVEPNEPTYREQYVLTADGYYGDMDANFRLEFSARENEEVRAMLDAYGLLKQLHEKRELKYDPEFINDYDLPGRDLVMTDEAGYFPEVESFELTWYNADGVPFNVEVADG